MTPVDQPAAGYERNGGYERRLRSVEIELTQVELRQEAQDEFLKEFREFIREVRPAMAALIRTEASVTHMRDSLAALATTSGTHAVRIAALESQMSVMQYVRAAVFAAIALITLAAGGLTWKAVTNHAIAGELRSFTREQTKE